MVKLRHPDRLGLHIRVVLPDGVVIGPGRADLLDAIRVHGSISAAGRALGMSYKRAWDLVSAMNSAFRAPVVQASAGGETGGGAALTEMARPSSAPTAGWRRWRPRARHERSRS